MLSGPKKRRTTDLSDNLTKQVIEKKSEPSNKNNHESKKNAEIKDLNSDTEQQEEEITRGNDEEIKTNAIKCNDCIFEKEIDKRNYNFGNLLIGELQFLAPCMRSEAYINILQYVDSLKQKHLVQNIKTRKHE